MVIWSATAVIKWFLDLNSAKWLLQSSNKMLLSLTPVTIISWFEVVPALFASIWCSANTQNIRFWIFLLWPIHIINLVDRTKLSCDIPHRRSTTHSFLRNYLPPPLFNTQHMHARGFSCWSAKCRFRLQIVECGLETADCGLQTADQG